MKPICVPINKITVKPISLPKIVYLILILKKSETYLCT